MQHSISRDRFASSSLSVQENSWITELGLLQRSPFQQASTEKFINFTGTSHRDTAALASSTSSMSYSPTPNTIQKDSHDNNMLGSFQCPYCPYRSNVKKYTDAHVRTHSQAQQLKKTFPCAECPYVATQMCNLRSHMRTHTGERPYKCCVCPKTFSHHHTLHGHHKTHSDTDATIVCSYCRSPSNMPMSVLMTDLADRSRMQ